MKYLFLLMLSFFASTANAGGFREDKAWDFLTPLENQLSINRAMYQDKHNGGMFDAQPIHYTVQTITNIGTMSYISGNGNTVQQTSSGAQTATNTISGSE